MVHCLTWLQGFWCLIAQRAMRRDKSKGKSDKDIKDENKNLPFGDIVEESDLRKFKNDQNKDLPSNDIVEVFNPLLQNLNGSKSGLRRRNGGGNYRFGDFDARGFGNGPTRIPPHHPDLVEYNKRRSMHDECPFWGFSGSKRIPSCDIVKYNKGRSLSDLRRSADNRRRSFYNGYPSESTFLEIESESKHIPPCDIVEYNKGRSLNDLRQSADNRCRSIDDENRLRGSGYRGGNARKKVISAYSEAQNHAYWLSYWANNSAMINLNSS